MDIGQHLNKNISQPYNGLDVSFDSFPADNKVDADAYKTAIDALSPGDAVTIFTPDTTHYQSLSTPSSVRSMF
jgi:D-galacturonate reductase